MSLSSVNLSSVIKNLIYQFSSESELLREIEKLSQNFTKSRDNISEYLHSDKLVAAYTCFYLLTNIPRLKSSFKMMDLNPDQYLDFEIFDIGAGPGTFSLAFLEHNQNFQITAIETSAPMKNQGEKLVKGIFPNASFSYQNLRQIKAKDKKRLGVFGHSANEMGKAIALKYIKELDLDEVIFIEPGTKIFFKTFLEIREELKQTYSIMYPCPQTGNCPLAENDWCHQYLSISHDSDVERLTQVAKKDRRSNPISVSHFKKNGISINQSVITRVYPPTKFSLEWQICSKDRLLDLQILSKTMSKRNFKQAKLINAGKRVQFEIDRELENNKVRGVLDGIE